MRMTTAAMQKFLRIALIFITSIAKTNGFLTEWSVSVPNNSVIESEPSPSANEDETAETSASAGVNYSLNSALDALQQRTLEFGSDSFDAMGQQRDVSERIRDQIQGWNAVATAAAAAIGNRLDEYTKNEYEYLKNTSAALVANALPEQLQLINDAVAMLDASYAYDAAQREIDLHRDCIAAAFDDLNNAARIVVTSPSPSSYSQQMQRVKAYVLSAVQHLRDSCPLCRALKYAANTAGDGVGEAAQNLLPFVTVLCSSILKTLHPFLTT